MAEAVGVVELRYVIDSTTPFVDAPAIDCTHAVGHVRLANDLLRVRPLRLPPTIAEARAVVAPMLDAWRIEDAIRFGHERIRFAFADAETIGPVTDIEVHPPEPLTHARDMTGDLLIAFTQYPAVPRIVVTRTMVDAWERFQYARIGIREPLQACAYYLLTVVESLGGGRNSASRKFAIDLAVLRKWGELTSTRGDASSARKVLGPDAPPLSRTEARWIESTVRSTLMQVGLVEAGELPPMLTMGDLGPV